MFSLETIMFTYFFQHNNMNVDDISVKRELETDNNDNDINNEVKKVKIETESETIIESVTLENPTITQTEEFTNSPSPLPHALTSKSRSEIRAQIDELQENDPIKEITKENDKIDQSSSTKVTKVKEINENSHNSNSKLIKQSNRKFEDIIDGSDLRRFLNKSLSGYLVKGLDEIVKLWESGEFEIDTNETNTNDDDNQLRKRVVLKFSDILKQLVDE